MTTLVHFAALWFSPVTFSPQHRSGTPESDLAKSDPSWAMCGLTDVLYVVHGSDFTSHHHERSAIALYIRVIHSTVARPMRRGRSNDSSEPSLRNYSLRSQGTSGQTPQTAPHARPPRAG